MNALLDEHTVPRSGKETASPLFGLLQRAGIVEVEADHAVLGAARIRNAWGGHGSGAAPGGFPSASPNAPYRSPPRLSHT
jgi:hypothetical protein